IALAEGGTAFGALSGGAAVVQFRPLDAQGNPVGSERTIAGALGAPAARPGLAPIAGGFLVAYAEGLGLRAALVSGGGEVAQDFELVAALGEDATNPSVAVSVDGADLAVAWKERVEGTLQTRLVRLHCE